MQLKNYACNSDSSSAAAQEQKKPMFTIPKLFTKHNDGGAENRENKKFTIDLTAALIPEKERKQLAKSEQRSKMDVVMVEERFTPQFIDCKETLDTPHSRAIVEFDEGCERITLRELRQSCGEAHSSNFSMMGKIIKKKYHKKVSYIRHAHARHTIDRFTFDTPSPDDKILAHLSKKK
jgi:hypothetical protein